MDCVFKAILGVQEHDWVLIDFLNSILKLPVPIRSAQIQNPYSEAEYEGDKQTIVDVLAKDGRGRQFIVEIQLKMHAALGERMLYGWTNAYRSQLSSGTDFQDLRPTYAIWLMRDSFTAPSVEAWHYRFEVWDIERRVRLSDHMQIHVLQLSRWRVSTPPDPVVDAEAAWLYFFKEAKGWRDLPATLHTPSLEKAMTVLKRFAENEADWHRYQAREHWLLLQATLERERRETQEDADRVREELEHMRAEAGLLREEHERLRAETERLRQQAQQAEQARQQAEQAQQQTRAERERAERLAARLRALGEDV